MRSQLLNTEDIREQVLIIKAIAIGDQERAQIEAQDLVNDFLRGLIGDDSQSERAKQAKLLLELEAPIMPSVLVI